jgi:L-alanine-DL-glutamate epimerase-like enolase superfamily enzyme
VPTAALIRDLLAAMAISAVDVALWDLKARILNVPLVTLLGATITCASRRCSLTVRGEVRFNDGDRALYSTDASNYRQIPVGPLDSR